MNLIFSLLDTKARIIFRLLILSKQKGEHVYIYSGDFTVKRSSPNPTVSTVKSSFDFATKTQSMKPLKWSCQ